MKKNVTLYGRKKTLKNENATFQRLFHRRPLYWATIDHFFSSPFEAARPVKNEPWFSDDSPPGMTGEAFTEVTKRFQSVTPLRLAGEH